MKMQRNRRGLPPPLSCGTAQDLSVGVSIGKVHAPPFAGASLKYTQHQTTKASQRPSPAVRGRFSLIYNPNT